MTPYYSDGVVTLWHGDLRDVLPQLDIKPDLCLTDPPYAETSLAWDRWPDGWPTLVADVTNSMWCFGSMRMFLDRRDEFGAWKLSQDVVWDKGNGTGLAADRFRRVHEFATHWYRGRWADIHRHPQRVEATRKYTKPQRQGRSDMNHLGGKTASREWVDDGTRLATSILRAPSVRGGIHPTEKHLDVLAPLIRYACPPGGLVLDCFAGSGSTAEAARATGRRAVLIEADQKYCAAIARRLDQGVLPLEAS